MAFNEKRFSRLEMKNIFEVKKEVIDKGKIKRNRKIFLILLIVVGGFFYIRNQAIILYEELKVINTHIKENAIYQIYLEENSLEKILIDAEIERLMLLKKEKEDSLKWINWATFTSSKI